MNKLLDGTTRRWRSLAVLAGAVSIGAALGVPSANASVAATSAPAAVTAPSADLNIPVARSSDGRTLVGAAALPAAGTESGGSAGTGRAADAEGVSYSHKLPKNIKMLDGGQGAQETVIGRDGRKRVTNTRAFPHRVTGLLTFRTRGGGSGGCTAWLYDDNTVGTAGHCVYTPGSGWHSNFRFWPGRNGGSAPYGSCGWRNAYTVQGWTRNGSPDYDYGAIKLNCTIGKRVGWFGVRWQSASYTGKTVTIAGYPGDKPSGTQWIMSGKVARSTTRQLFYSIDTYGGQSGSAVRLPGCGRGNWCAVAVHSYGRYGGSPYNRGTRITKAAFDNYQRWRR